MMQRTTSSGQRDLRLQGRLLRGRFQEAASRGTGAQLSLSFSQGMLSGPDVGDEVVEVDELGSVASRVITSWR